jgi:predicted Zn finger-like uncharacterized protein
MPIEIHCPKCNGRLRVPEERQGRKVKCPKCQSIFTAPEPVSEEVPPEPAAAVLPSSPAEDAIEEEPPRRRRARAVEDEEDDEEDDRPRRRGGRSRRRDGRRGREKPLFVDTRGAMAAVSGPAVALKIVGGICLALTTLGLFLNLGRGVGQMAWGVPGTGGSGQVAGSLLGLCWGGVVTAGAVQMSQLRAYGFAMTACIVAMIPASGCCILGLPFGVWGLVTLLREDVKNAFN